MLITSIKDNKNTNNNLKKKKDKHKKKDSYLNQNKDEKKTNFYLNKIDLGNFNAYDPDSDYDSETGKNDSDEFYKFREDIIDDYFQKNKEEFLKIKNNNLVIICCPNGGSFFDSICVKNIIQNKL